MVGNPRRVSVSCIMSKGNAARRVLFKQRDNRFYPPSAWSLAMMLVRIPFQLVEAAIYSGIVYFWVGEIFPRVWSPSVMLRHAEPCCSVLALLLLRSLSAMTSQ